MERLPSMKEFEIGSKDVDDEERVRWRERTFTLNPTRRFRHTINVEKRKELVFPFPLPA
mgnify:CR=1 FL=1